MQFSLEKTHEHLFAISESKYAILLTYVSIDLQNIGGKNEESLLHCLEYDMLGCSSPVLVVVGFEIPCKNKK